MTAGPTTAATAGDGRAAGCEAEVGVVQLLGWWHGAFAVTVAFTGAWSVAQVGDPARLGAELGLLAALAGWYAVAPGGLVRRRAAGAAPSWVATGRAYLVGALLVYAVAAFVYAGADFLLFILIPQCFFLLALRPAIVAVAGLTIVSTASQLTGGPVTSGELTSAGLFGVMTIVLAVLIGGYIDRLVEQSRQRAALIDELHRTRDELAAVSRRAGVLAERQRLASEIHDTLAQDFASILMLMQAAQARPGPLAGELRSQLAAAESTAREGLAEARSLVAALAPVPLQTAPLGDALGRVVTDFAARTGVAAAFAVTGTPAALAPNAEVVVLRALQEGLTNVGRHAGAATATAELRYDAGACELVVTDDGCGLGPAPVDGYGLAGMRARVAEVGGTLSIGAGPAGRGVRLAVRVPVEGPAS